LAFDILIERSVAMLDFNFVACNGRTSVVRDLPVDDHGAFIQIARSCGDFIYLLRNRGD
jgi:hypothetical protein